MSRNAEAVILKLKIKNNTDSAQTQLETCFINPLETGEKSIVIYP